MILTEENKKKLKGFAIAGGSLSLIGSLFVSYAVHEKVTINPLRWILGVFQYGFPFRYFLVFALLFTGLIVYADIRMSKDLEKDERNFFYTKNGTYGTARLLRTPQEIKGVAKIQPPAYACGTILGQQDRSGKRLINQDIFDKSNHRNKHVAVFGASSSGKTFSYVKPFCIQSVRRRESLVITDPKGELYEDTVKYFQDSGYVVRRFDLKDLARSDGWDILAEIRGDPDRADILAKIIWSNISSGSSSGVFESGPVSLLKAILLRVALDDHYAENKEQNIGTAYQMLQNEQGEAFLEELFDPEKMIEGRSAEEARKLKACIGPYMSYKQGSPNMRGNILITLSSLLNVFQSDLVRKVTSTNDIDLTLPGRKPCVYYCILPDMHSTYNFIGALFFSFLFLDLVDYADNSPGRRCKVPVNFLLDEFANIGSIPEFDKKLATIRSRALNVSIILQDLPQLMGRYPETYKSILSNCATYVCIGCNDEDTATFFSNRAGEATIQVRTDQHEKTEPAWNMGRKHSTGEGKRKVFTNDELMTLKMDECLIVWQALYTMRAYKYPYTSHPEASRMESVPAADYPLITDKDGRKRMRDEEEKRIEEYEKKMNSGWNQLEYFGGTMANVPDEEWEASQRIFWYEMVYLKGMELLHTTKRFLKKQQRNYNRRKKTISEERLNPNYVDASAIIKDEPDEEFEISVSDVEDIVFSIDADFSQTEMWNFAEEEDFDSHSSGNEDCDEDKREEKDDDASLPEDEQPEKESQSKEKPEGLEEEDAEEASCDNPYDDDADFTFVTDITDAFIEDDNSITEHTDAPLIQPDLPKEDKLQKQPVNQSSKKKEPPSKPKGSKKEDFASRQEQQEPFAFDWELLGDPAQYEIQPMPIETSSGSDRIDNAIRDTLDLLEGRQPKKEDKPKPNVDDLSSEDKEDMLDYLFAEQAKRANKTSRSTSSKNRVKIE